MSITNNTHLQSGSTYPDKPAKESWKGRVVAKEDTDVEGGLWAWMKTFVQPSSSSNPPKEEYRYLSPITIDPYGGVSDGQI